MSNDQAAQAGWEGMSAPELVKAVTALRDAFGVPEDQQVVDVKTAAAKAATEKVPPQTQVAKDEAANKVPDEKARIKAILSHAEAKDRQTQAQVLALETSLSVEESVALLAKLPKETGAKGAQALYTAVAAQGGNPRVKHLAEPDEAQKARSKSFAASMDKIVASQPKPAS